MSLYSSIEDAYIDFFDLIIKRSILPEANDRAPIKNFGNLIYAKKQLTEKQARFIISLLKKYSADAIIHGVDYIDLLNNPVWREEFRHIDYAKKVWTEVDENNSVWICLKFPYNLKLELDNIVKTDNWGYSDIFDKERKVRMLLASEYNILEIDQFISNYGFEQDLSYAELVSFAEEAVNNIDSIIPYSLKNSNNIELINATEEAYNEFESKKTGNINSDMLIAKTLGYSYMTKGYNTIEQFCSLDADLYWLKTFKDFLLLAQHTNDCVVFIKDRALDSHKWLENFMRAVEETKIDKTEILMGFRGDEDFNQKIKELGITGKVSNQKYLIFEHKPPKWLFSKEIDFTIIGTDICYISNNKLLCDLLFSHPCAVYVDDKNLRPVMFHFENREAVVAEL